MTPNQTSTNVKQGDAAAPPHLPVIDLSEVDSQKHDEMVKTLARAAETCGFFQVVNHGLQDEFLEQLKDSAHGFFNQPEDKKAVYLNNQVTPTPLVSFFPVVVMDILRMTYTSDEDALRYWPDSCKEVALEYLKASKTLAARILGLLMRNLGVTLDEATIDACMKEDFLTMNCYPSCPDQNENAGLSKHTDTTVLTILLQDHVGGLFGRLKEAGDVDNNYNGEWVEIKPIPGALVVLVGDSLQVLSNGKYMAGEHYVQTTGTARRVSIPAFMNPRPNTKIGPVPQVVEKDGGKPRYKEILFEEYRDYAYSVRSAETMAIDSLQIMFP